MKRRTLLQWLGAAMALPLARDVGASNRRPLRLAVFDGGCTVTPPLDTFGRSPGVLALKDIATVRDQMDAASVPSDARVCYVDLADPDIRRFAAERGVHLPAQLRRL